MENEEIKKHFKKARQTGAWKSCLRKIGYSEKSAIKAAEKMNVKTTRENFHILEAYPCPFCGKWHIGRKMSEEELNN